MIKSLSIPLFTTRAPISQAFAASIAGYALSFTTGLAMLSSFLVKEIPFKRTPKSTTKLSFVNALHNCKYELILMLLLCISILGILFYRTDAMLLDTILWMTLLLVQLIAYALSVILSFIAFIKSPCDLISNMSLEQKLNVILKR
jgi:hypothetical protein